MSDPDQPPRGDRRSRRFVIGFVVVALGLALLSATGILGNIFYSERDTVTNTVTAPAP